MYKWFVSFTRDHRVIMCYLGSSLHFWSRQPPWEYAASDFSFIWRMEGCPLGQIAEPAIPGVGPCVAVLQLLITCPALHPTAGSFFYCPLSSILAFQDSSGKLTLVFPSFLPSFLFKVYFTFFVFFFPPCGRTFLSTTWGSRFFGFGGDFHLLCILQEFFPCLKVPPSMSQYYSGFVLLLMPLVTF